MFRDSTPKQDGFHMPAEWETHKGTWMMWPYRRDNWRNESGPAQRVFAELANTIAKYEMVTMCVDSANFAQAAAMLASNVRVVEMSSDDSWMRDIGPAFVKNDRGEIRGVHWGFNGWGGLTERWDRDEQVGEKILRMEMFDRYKPAFILEGGSIHVDGEGTAITTEECLLHGERNKTMNKQQIEKYLIDFLGVEKVIWLPFGVVHDETRGHVDNMACFIRPAEIALCWTDDPSHPQYERSNAALKLLESETDAKGRPFRVHRVNLPPQLYITEEEAQGVEMTHSNMIRKTGQPLAGSYINFYICNGAVIVPQFNVPTDAEALKTIRSFFPDREVIGLYSREVLLGGGNLHCITNQQPLQSF